MVPPRLLRVICEGDFPTSQTQPLWGEMWRLCNPAETRSLGQEACNALSAVGGCSERKELPGKFRSVVESPPWWPIQTSFLPRRGQARGGASGFCHLSPGHQGLLSEWISPNPPTWRCALCLLLVGWVGFYFEPVKVEGSISCYKSPEPPSSAQASMLGLFNPLKRERG